MFTYDNDTYKVVYDNGQSKIVYDYDLDEIISFEGSYSDLRVFYDFMKVFHCLFAGKYQLDD